MLHSDNVAVYTLLIHFCHLGPTNVPEIATWRVAIIFTFTGFKTLVNNFNGGGHQNKIVDAT